MGAQVRRQAACAWLAYGAFECGAAFPLRTLRKQGSTAIAEFVARQNDA
jgi:hypothetical protein